MKCVPVVLLLLALPAMLIPHRVSLCVCEECACCHTKEETGGPSCCSHKSRIPRDAIKSCERLELENPAPETDCPQIVTFALPEESPLPLPVHLPGKIPASRPEPPAVATPPPIHTPILI